MLHNVDTVGAALDAGALGFHIRDKSAMTVEIIVRHLEDRGGGLARIDGRLRLVEGLALPGEECEAALSYYNSNTIWIDLDQILSAFELMRSDLPDSKKVNSAVRRLAARIPRRISL